jgi:hypothetical protein
LNKSLHRKTELYKAPLILIAHITYTTKSGHYIKETEKAIDRCYSEKEAERIKKEIHETLRTKQISVSPVLYKTILGPAQSFRGWNRDNNKEVIEKITGFELITREQFIKRGY